MSGGSKVTVYLLMNRTDFLAGRDEVVAASTEMGDVINKTGEESAANLEKAFTTGTSKVGGLFQRLGSIGQSMGIPLSGTFTKMGTAMDDAAAQGDGLKATLEGIGGLITAVGVAAAGAIAVESFKMWDEYSHALTALKVALTDTGNSFAAFTPAMKAAQAQGARFGFDMGQVTTALTDFVTATKSTSKATTDLTLAENIAVSKNESLATATQSLNSVLAGSQRALRSFGINIDVSSGHVHSLVQAQQQLQAANIGLHGTILKINSGFETGPSAQVAYAQALQRVQVAEYNVHIASTSTAKILQTLTDRFSGAAAAKAGTFAGKIDALRARMHNLGIEIGGHLESALMKLEGVLANVIDFFDRFHAAAVMLEAALAAGLAVTVGTFLVGKIGDLIEWIGQVGPSFGVTAEEAVKAMNTADAGVSTAVDGIIISTNELLASIAKLGPETVLETTEMEASFAALDTALEASQAAMVTTGEAMTLAMGPVGIAIMAVVTAATALAVIWKNITQMSAQDALQNNTAIAASINQTAQVTGNVPGLEKSISAMKVQRARNAPVTYHVNGMTRTTFQSPEQKNQYDSLTRNIAAFTAELATIQQNHAGLGHGPGSTYQTTAAQKRLNTMNFNKSNLRLAEPAVHIATEQNPLAKRADSMLKTMQSSLESSSIRSMRNATDPANKALFEALITTLKSVHEKAMNKLVDQLESTWKAETTTLTQLLLARQMVGIADQTATIAQAMNDMTTVITDRFDAQATILQDQSNIATAKLNERGLYGLNLVAQKMTLGLDKLTIGYDRTINTYQVNLGLVTKQQDILVGNAKKRMDMLQGNIGAAYTLASSAYKEAQSHASLVEAQATRTLQEAQGNAKVGEAKQQELIAIEQAKANTEFAGSGVHIQITGINPTDAAAVANAVSWNMRTKIPA